MNTVKIASKFYGMANEATGTRESVVQLKDESRIGDLIYVLSQEYGEKFTYLVYDESRSFRDYLFITVNNVDIMSLDRFETELSDGDVILFIPPIGGG